MDKTFFVSPHIFFLQLNEDIISRSYNIVTCSCFRFTEDKAQSPTAAHCSEAQIFICQDNSIFIMDPLCSGNCIFLDYAGNSCCLSLT